MPTTGELWGIVVIAALVIIALLLVHKPGNDTRPSTIVIGLGVAGLVAWLVFGGGQ